MFGFCWHKWNKWSQPIEIYERFSSGRDHLDTLTGFRIERTCSKCNLLKTKKVGLNEKG